MANYKLVMNDASTYALAALPYESIIQRKGVNKKVMCIPFGSEIDTVEKVKLITNDELKMSKFEAFNDNQSVRVETDYTVLEQITYETLEVLRDDMPGVYDEVTTFVAKLSKSDSVQDLINSLEEKVKTLTATNASLKSTIENLTNKVTEASTDISNIKDKVTSNDEKVETAVSAINTRIDEVSNTVDSKIDEVKNSVDTEKISNQISSVEKEVATLKKDSTSTEQFVSELEAVRNEVSNLKNDIGVDTLSGKDPESLTLDEYKTLRIKDSKNQLDAYLANNFVESDVHGGKTNKYSITFEKQQQLTTMIVLATNNENYQPSWNVAGKAATYDWTVDELKALATQIDAKVRPLVNKQQNYERKVTAATSKEDIDKIVFTLD